MVNKEGYREEGYNREVYVHKEWEWDGSVHTDNYWCTQCVYVQAMYTNSLFNN